MIKKPCLIDAILGNGRMLVTLTADAEIQRLFWPHVDGGQHVARLLGGVAVDGKPFVWQDDPAWESTQAYEPDQNVLATTARLPSGLLLDYRDAVLPTQPVPGCDLLMRQVTITNRGPAAIQVAYGLYQWVQVNEQPLYNTAVFDEPSDSLIHYQGDTYMALGADRPLDTFAVGDPDSVRAAAAAGSLWGNPIKHGDVAAAGSWNLGELAPAQSVTLTLFWGLGTTLAGVRDALQFARRTGGEALLADTRAFWRSWLQQAHPLAATVPAGTAELYRRSLLVFALMADQQTGAVIAAPEFDPAFESCGGYAYCWGRDAAYITVAMDVAGYHDLAARFYQWAVQAQEPEGWWMHRHYTNGRWAPSWGLIQVDETGSILYGMGVHARLHGGVAFAQSVWPNVRRAAEWLLADLDPETGLPLPAVDLWEERTAELTYSAGAVYAGLEAAGEIAALVGDHKTAARYQAKAEDLQVAILRECVRNGRFMRGRFLQLSADEYQAARTAGKAVRQRTTAKGYPVYELDVDPTPDASLLGLAIPFRVVPAPYPVMAETAREVNAALWQEPVGGIGRYVGDQYRGGNPWILCTLWLGLYEAERGNNHQALHLLEWAVARRSRTGLLAEQVDPVTGDPAWVLPLTWSHAMYVLLAIRLYGAGA